jgi:hypothetical protein
VRERESLFGYFYLILVHILLYMSDISEIFFVQGLLARILLK